MFEQVTGKKPPVDIVVPTPADILKDPIGNVVNPTKYLNPLGIPTQGDFVEMLVKDPEAAIQLVLDPTKAPYALVATQITSSRNAALASGVSPIPEPIRAKLRKWYPDSLMDGVRWNAKNDVLNGIQQHFAINHLESFGGKNANAITLINVIVFKNDTIANDVAIWGHELLHVQQYAEWGIQEFARKYLTDDGGVERPAYQRQSEIAQELGIPDVQVASSSSSSQSPQPSTGPDTAAADAATIDRQKKKAEEIARLLIDEKFSEVHDHCVDALRVRMPIPKMEDYWRNVVLLNLVSVDDIRKPKPVRVGTIRYIEVPFKVYQGSLYVRMAFNSDDDVENMVFIPNR